MEWDFRELEWIEENKLVLEDKNLESAYQRLMYSRLDSPEKKHLAIGLALVFDLPIILKISKDGCRTHLLVEELGPGYTIGSNSYHYPKSENILIRDYTSDLRKLGLSENLILKVISKIKIRSQG
jgi:hypothetical protein